MPRVSVIPLLLVVPLAGCGPAADTPPPWRTYEDALGRKVALAAPPKRVVSLAPGNTEILFALGAGDRVVGVTEGDDYPAAVKDLPKVGGFHPQTMSVDAIVALKPDLVVCSDAFHAPIVRKLEALGVPVMAHTIATLDDVFRNIEQTAEWTGTADRGAALVADLRRRAEAVAARTAARPAERRPRVFYEVSSRPLWTAGARSFLHQLIERGGGTNVYADLDKSYAQVGDEPTIRRDPEVILAPARGDPDAQRAAIRGRAGWADVAAVKNGRIHFIDEDTFSRPGPRLVDALEQLEKTLHPAP